MKDISDALSMAHRIKNKELSPQQACQQAIEKIKEFNPLYNAIHHQRFEEALAEAEQFNDDQAPFAGVPIVIKDLGQQLEGALDSSGSGLLKDNYAKQTNHYVQRLKKAGFIILGQTNVPEFGIKFISDSKHFGPVKNPIDPTCHAGGSSGGSAAAIQSSMVSIATASDGGGSIRIPASFTGLIGLKPTTGRMPLGPSQWRSWGGGAVHFALTQTIRDTEALFLHMQTDQLDAMPYRLPKLPKQSIDQAKEKVSSLKIALVKRPAWDSDEVMTALDQLEGKLKQDGFNVEWVDPQLDIKTLVWSYYKMNACEIDKILTSIENKRQAKVRKEELEPLTWALRSYGQLISGGEYSALLDLWDQASHQMSQLFSQVDILIQPTTTGPAPRLDADLYPDQLLKEIQSTPSLSARDWQERLVSCLEPANRLSPYALIDNLTGIPAMSLPLWTCQDGRPLGLQLSAAKGREDLLFALSSYMEEHDYFHYYK